LEEVRTFAWEIWRITPIAVLILVWLFTGWTGFPARFYEIAAQVLPVLLLVLAIELRLFAYPSQYNYFRSPKGNRELADPNRRSPAMHQFQRWYRLLPVLAAMVVGEFFAVRSVAYPDDTWGDGLILGAIAAGLFLILVVAVGRDRR
jgi:hypothetical protein